MGGGRDQVDCILPDDDEEADLEQIFANGTEKCRHPILLLMRSLKLGNFQVSLELKSDHTQRLRGKNGQMLD